MTSQDNYDALIEQIRLTALLSEIYEVPITLTNYEDDSIIFTTKRFTKMTGFESNSDSSDQQFGYRDIIHPKDIEITAEINQNGKRILTNTFKEKPFAKAFMTYNIKIKQVGNDYKPMKVIVKPIAFNHDGTPKYKVALFLPIVQKGYQRFALYTESNGGNELYYSSLRRKFVEHETIELKPIEIELLRLTSKGHREVQIAKKLDIKVDLLRYYKRNVYKKYHVCNMTEAVYIALFYELI